MIYTVTLNPAVDRELSVPAIEFNTVLRASDWRVDFGGKGFNVSRLLRALGTPSIALGFAGGRSGELLHDGLRSLDIDTEFVWVEGDTRTNVSIVSLSEGKYVKANEPGPVISEAKQAELIQKIQSLAHPGDWWVLAGSLPPGVPGGIYADIIKVVQPSGGRVLLDTSGEALELGCEAAPYMVKPNAYEAGVLTGRSVSTEGEIAMAATAIQQMGPECVVISLGGDGAMLVGNGQTWFAASPQIEERNPIGAGDSMVGGLVWGLSKDLPLDEALSWGVACGAATASLSGTAVGSRSLVQALHEQVQVRAIQIPTR